ncbi:MAG: phosphoglycerate dehydrogenase [Methanospirillum sp.]|nr:phosphoglycerate dehydrogenase [Methanospirillum sp.]
MNHRVLVSDPLAGEGIEILRREVAVDVRTDLTEDDLVGIIGDYDALLVRSGTQVTARVIEAGTKLRFIGRAGAGVDNIDTDAATRRGIIVANAPAGNTLAATEHTCAMMLSLARNIPQANASVRSREWKRSRFTGVEVNEKTLGIVGFGRIGREVAQRATAMNMRIIAYDPFIAKERAEELGVEITDLPDLFRRADFITLHTPLIRETRHMINAETIATMKEGVRIINCARGGIIDEGALHDGIVAGKVAGAALDVFEDEPPFDSPLLSLEQVIVTPHLGASTVEAQVNVAIEVARQALSVLSGGDAKYVVNAPMIPPDQADALEPFSALMGRMARLLMEMSDGRLSGIQITYAGEIPHLEQASRYLTRQTVKTLLEQILHLPVNLVNAGLVAAERGIAVGETVGGDTRGFRNLITISLKTDRGEETIEGSVFSRTRQRVVAIDGYTMDLDPTGHLVISKHLDRPGVIGRASTTLGRAEINIAGMQVGRIRQGEEAIMVLNVDSPVPPEAIEEIRTHPGIHAAWFVSI